MSRLFVLHSDEESWQNYETLRKYASDRPHVSSTSPPLVLMRRLPLHNGFMFQQKSLLSKYKYG